MVLALLVYAGVAVTWTIANITFEPHYGDTVEYWGISKTLVFDTWRTIGYPLVLHTASFLSNDAIRHIVVYCFQIVASVLALYYFIATLDHVTHSGRHMARNFSLAALVAFAPVVAHMNLSILSDSLANTLFILAASAILRLTSNHKVSAPTLVVAAVGVIASGLMRQDRLLNLMLIVLALGLWAIWSHRFRLVAALGLLLVVSLATNQFNRLTQKGNLGRPAISPAYMVFDRVGRGRLAGLRTHMPAVIQQRLSPADAELWDNSPPYWPVVAGKLNDRAGHKAMIQGTLVVLRYEGVQVAAAVLADTVEYTLAPAAYAAGSFLPAFDPGATGWTNSRMAEKTPSLTYLYILLFTILFVIAASITLVRARKELPAWPKRVLGYWALVISVVAIISAATSSNRFHIRYGLPIFTIEVALIAWLLVQHHADADLNKDGSKRVRSGMGVLRDLYEP